jgi:hypothetical protein
MWACLPDTILAPTRPAGAGRPRSAARPRRARQRFMAEPDIASPISARVTAGFKWAPLRYVGSAMPRACLLACSRPRFTPSGAASRVGRVHRAGHRPRDPARLKPSTRPAAGSNGERDQRHIDHRADPPVSRAQDRERGRAHLTIVARPTPTPPHGGTHCPATGGSLPRGGRTPRCRDGTRAVQLRVGRLRPPDGRAALVSRAGRLPRRMPAARHCPERSRRNPSIP